MRIIAAYMLAVLGGNATPDEKAIKKILDSVDIKADEARVTDLVNKLKGKDIDAIIEEGKAKIGAAAPVAAAAAPAAAAGGAAKGGASKGKEKEPEPEPAAEEEDSGMGGLFD